MKQNYSYTFSGFILCLIAVVACVCWYIGPNQHAIQLQNHIHQDHHRSTQSLGNCEKCRKPLKMVHGKYGAFVGCSGYPACRYIQREKASFSCPSCNGSIQKRSWSGGVLWGCENYPDCRYAIFSDIEDMPCLQCKKSLYLLKKQQEDGTYARSCPNAECRSKS